MADVSTLLPCAMETGDSFDIYVDTGGDADHEREIWLPWNCSSVDVMDVIDDDGRRYCRLLLPRVDTNRNRFTLLVPVPCLASPARLRVSAYLLSDHSAKSLRGIPGDRTAWTPYAAVGERTSVEDAAGDTH